MKIFRQIHQQIDATKVQSNKRPEKSPTPNVHRVRVAICDAFLHNDEIGNNFG